MSGFNIHNGLAETTALVADTTNMSVVSDGEVNLKTEELDLSIDRVPKEGIGTGVTGKWSMGLGELTKPFKLRGTLANPSLGVDTIQAAKSVSKRPSRGLSYSVPQVLLRSWLEVVPTMRIYAGCCGCG